MAEAKEVAPIIVIKKKVNHGGHHGGAWKVAYADFVTAMMAFFMVMWLLNSGTKVKEAVAGYFNDPVGYKNQIGSAQAGSGESLSLSKDDMPNLKNTLEQALKEMPKFQEIKDQVKFTVTGEGLRIELLETEDGMFFTSGSSVPSPKGRELLTKMAAELTKLPNTLFIEGHTDAKPFASGEYSNWELSADRANSARKLMQTEGLRPDQVVQVRGFASQRLFKKDDATHASNRRVSIIVRYQNAKEEPGDTEVQAKGHGDGHGAAAGGHGTPAAGATAHAAPAAAPAAAKH